MESIDRLSRQQVVLIDISASVINRSLSPEGNRFELKTRRPSARANRAASLDAAKENWRESSRCQGYVSDAELSAHIRWIDIPTSSEYKATEMH